jgi:hypothetical protein
MNLPDEIYIIVCENDGTDENPNIPIALETYLDERCNKEEADHRAALLGCRYGEVKIGRLVMDDEEIVNFTDAMTEEEKKNQPF